MAVTLSGSQGVFTRIGHLAGETNRVIGVFGTTLNSNIQTIFSDFTTTDQSAINGLFPTRDAYRGVHSAYLGDLTKYAQQTVVEQVNRDTTLANRTLSAALAELVAQMKSASASISRPTISVTTTAGGANENDYVVVTHTKNGSGDPLDLMVAETLKATCTGDAGTGGTKWVEPFTVTGQPARATTDYLWPGGSGATATLSAADAVSGAGSRVADGAFASWTGAGSNTPVFWTVSTGTEGTDVLRNASPLRGTYCLRIVSDGTTLTTVRQTVSLLPNTVYAVCLFGRMSALDASGALRVRLSDGAGVGTTVADDAGTDNTASFGTNGGGGIGTSWSTASAAFRTPRQLPDVTTLEIGLTASPSATKTLDIDLVTLAPMTQLYAGGPYMSIHSRAAAAARGDTFNLVAANDATNTTFTRAADRLLGLRSLGLYLPSSGSPTVSNALITI